MSKTKKTKRGAPLKREDQKIDPNGLTRDQNEKLQSEHLRRGVPVKVIVREAIDWYFQALEEGRKVPVINSQLEEAEITET